MKYAETLKKDALFLIDGSYLLYRSFFAIKPLHTSTGIPTNALYGFCRAMKKLIDTFSPRYVAVVWDSKGPTHRTETYAAYKAHRPPPPSELMQQKELIFDFIECIGIKNIALSGYEADDLVATLAKKHLAEQTVLVCADKDLYQLLDDSSVIIADLFKDEISDASAFTAKNGFPPARLSFFHALLGDASDNIPGVKGIGEKSASQLVQTFASLDELYNNLHTIQTKRIANALAQHEADARLSLDLFTLVDAPIEARLEDFVFAADNWARAADFFRKYECTSLIGTISSPVQHRAEHVAFVKPATDGWKLVVVETMEALESLYQKLCTAKIYSFDTETKGQGYQQEMVGMSFAFDLQEAFYLPFAHPEGGVYKNLPMPEALALLKQTLENPSHHKVLQHAKFDLHVVQRYGIRTQGVVFDTLIAASLVKQNWATINLKDLSMRLLNERMQTYDEVVGKRYKHFGLVPIEDAASYGAHDARQTLAIMPILEKMLKQDAQIESYFENIDMPFADLLFRMETLGIKFDADLMKRVDEKVVAELEQIEAKLQAAVPQRQMSIGESASFNFNSPRQIETLLFDELKLPVMSKTAKGSRSTDQEVLEKLAELHFIPALILKYRELTKLRSTYTVPLPEQVNPRTGRIHTTFSQTLVATGRLSSSDPNLQNIPASSEYAHAIRGAFVASPGHVLISADYSQIELRILAHVSNDEVLCNAFKHDVDIHRQTAAQLLGVAPDQVTQQQRQLGKQLNFSIMYGLTPFGLAQTLNLAHKDAKAYIERYFQTYHRVKDWMDRTVSFGKEHGYVATLWGRRRYIPELQDKNHTVFESGRRAAINSPIQGSQADLMKIAMLRVDKALAAGNFKTNILLQIHDEIILEAPQEELSLVENIVREALEQAVQWSVPLKVALRAGKDWGEISK